MFMADLRFPSSALWAKKSDSSGVFLWLPLEQHLLDTCQVITALWQHWLNAASKREITLALSEVDEEIALKLVRFLALTHDLGKAIPAFQAKKRGHIWSDLDRSLLEKLALAGFTGLETLRLTSPGETPHALAGQVILRKLGIGEDVASIVGSHHGRPTNSYRYYEKQTQAYTANYYQSDRLEDSCIQIWSETHEAIVRWALSKAGFNSPQELPHITLRGQVLLSGLLIMADWLASNEAYFPLVSLDMNKITNQEARFETGWLHWYKAKAEVFTLKGDIRQLYADSFGFAPRPLQEEFGELVGQISEPGLIILEAPMGIGKTEMALAAAEQLGSRFGQDGIYFGLPTQATSDGIFERIARWVEGLGNEGLPGYKSLQLVHGKSALNEVYQNLKHKSSNPDEEVNGAVSANAWFVGKKTASLDDFVVGTVDQFLMLALEQKHLALRHLGFSSKVVIIDEVHAYDVYMGQYLNRALEWIGAYNVPVIMLSATLPGQQREAFLKSYLKGQKHKWHKVERPPDLAQLASYPLVSFTEGPVIKQRSNFSAPSDRVVEVSLLAEEDLVTQVEDLLADGGVLGLIVNTVKRAQALAALLADHFGDDTVEVLHSQYIATDRIAKEQALLNMIGKGKVRPAKKIIIGTQVMEQSLDIDFDVLISDLAPMDLLLQRIGRLHRHSGVQRPAKLSKAQAFILGTNPDYSFDPGSEFVYGQYLLMRTQYFLPSKILLPSDISPMVQQVYEAEDLKLDSISSMIYAAAKDKSDRKISQKESAANSYRLGEPHSRKQKSLVGWLRDVNLQSEEKGYAQVRDTDETIEVILLQSCEGGYSLVGESEDISSQINDPVIAQKLARQTINLPRAVTYNSRDIIDFLEDYNKRYLQNWQRQPWLKGSLGLILDQQGNFTLGKYQLTYRQDRGLQYTKVED